MSGYVSKAEALTKLQRYCAYQDRCHKEVRSKLLDLGIYGDTLEEIMAELVTENFLNEERFARSFVRGKFRIKNWGRIRILQELRTRHISDYCTRKGLEEIDPEDYEQALINLLQQKYDALHSEKDVFKRKHKTAQYAIRRGFESQLVWQTLKNFID